MYQKLGLVVPWPDQSDLGRFEITKKDEDKMMFKVPVLRKAFWEMMNDKAYLDDAEKQRIPVNPISGEDVQAYIEKLVKMPKDVVERANRAADGDPSLVSEAKLNWLEAKATTLDGIDKGRIVFKDRGKTVRVEAGEDTAITVAGKKAERKDLHAGLVCDVRYLGDGDAAGEIKCQ